MKSYNNCPLVPLGVSLIVSGGILHSVNKKFKKPKPNKYIDLGSDVSIYTGCGILLFWGLSLATSFKKD